MKKVIITASLIVCFIQSTLGHGDIKSSLERGFTFGISEYVGQMIEADTLVMEVFAAPVYTPKKKAIAQLKKFFKKYPPQLCAIEKQGMYKNSTRYFDGTYTTTEGKEFKIYFEAALDFEEGEYHLSHVRVEKAI